MPGKRKRSKQLRSYLPGSTVKIGLPLTWYEEDGDKQGKSGAQFWTSLNGTIIHLETRVQWLCPLLHLPYPVVGSCTFHPTVWPAYPYSLPLPWFRPSLFLIQAPTVIPNRLCSFPLSIHPPYSCQWSLKCKPNGVTPLFKIPPLLSIFFWVKSKFLNMAHMVPCDQPHSPTYLVIPAPDFCTSQNAPSILIPLHLYMCKNKEVKPLGKG